MRRDCRPFSDVVLRKPASQSLGITTAMWQAFMRKYLTMDTAPEVWVRPMEDGELEVFYILPPDARARGGGSVGGGEILLLRVPAIGWEYKQ